MSEVVAKANKNGPLIIVGNFTMIDENGNATELNEGNVYLCRCGVSKNKPFCDGAHKQCGFEGPQFSLEKSS